jgi:drug/metabolite transporter (DMT)-like permease
MTEQRKGELFILSEALIWSIFPVVTVSSFTFLNPVSALAWTTAAASLFFAILLTVQRKWKELLNFSALYDIFWVGIIIGTVFYGIVFFALKYTSAGNVTMIALMEVLYAYLFFHVWRKEHIDRPHIFGALLMTVGAIIVLLHGFTFKFSIGDLLIFFGVAITPLGNFFQQRARKKVSSTTVSFGRSLITSVVCFAGLYLFGIPMAVEFNRPLLIFLFLNGFVIFGLNRILFLEGIHRINVTKAAAMSSIGPLLTILFAWIYLHQHPEAFQFIAFIPMFAGLLFITWPGKNRP